MEEDEEEHEDEEEDGLLTPSRSPPSGGAAPRDPATNDPASAASGRKVEEPQMTKLEVIVFYANFRLHKRYFFKTYFPETVDGDGCDLRAVSK